MTYRLPHSRKSNFATEPRRLQYVFRLDQACLEEVRQELLFTQVACDAQGAGLVWQEQGSPPVPPPGAMRGPSAPADTTAAPLPLAPAPAPSVTEPAPPAPRPTALPEATLTDAPQDEPAVIPEPARSAPEAERRQLTVMFCDLADSTRLSQQLDAEDLREVVRAYQATAAAVIQQYAGHIAQYLGDGLLVYFGWPVAHEDEPCAACMRGGGIVEAITTTLNPRLLREKGVPLAVRSESRPDPWWWEKWAVRGWHQHLATGDTVHIAARLEGLAAPNTVVISQVTARLVRGRRSGGKDPGGGGPQRGHRAHAGVSGVAGCWRPRWTSPRWPGVPFLVGRDEELGLLRRRWEQAKERLGQVVLLSGTAGLGKSALTEVLRAQVARRGCGPASPCAVRRITSIVPCIR